MWSKIFGWHALLLIALAITAAELLKAHGLVRRALWVLAAVIAVVGAWNTWRSR